MNIWILMKNLIQENLKILMFELSKKMELNDIKKLLLKIYKLKINFSKNVYLIKFYHIKKIWAIIVGYYS